MAVHLKTTAAIAQRRSTWALVAPMLLAALALEVGRSGHWAPALAGLILPDLALALGADGGLAAGRLHPRAVPAYNAVHALWGPVALVALASSGVIALPWLVAGLAWATHVAVDRAMGYGLRDRRGFQRGD